MKKKKPKKPGKPCRAASAVALLLAGGCSSVSFDWDPATSRPMHFEVTRNALTSSNNVKGSFKKSSDGSIEATVEWASENSDANAWQAVNNLSSKIPSKP